MLEFYEEYDMKLLVWWIILFLSFPPFSVLLSFHPNKLYDYDFEFQCGPVRAFMLSPQVTHVLASERMLFTLSHNDDVEDKCSVSERDRNIKNTCKNKIASAFV